MTNNQFSESKSKMGHGCCCSAISWSGIFAGAFVAIGLSFLLNAFATSIGLSAFIISAADNVTSIAIGGFIALLIGVIVVMFVSGWVAGFINYCNCRDHCTGALAGFLSWCMALVIAGTLAVQLGQLFNVNYIVGQGNTAARFNIANVGETSGSSSKASHAEQASTAKSSASANAHEGEKMMSTVGKAVLFTFLLFLFGALASTFGGHCGMKRCRKSERKNTA